MHYKILTLLLLCSIAACAPKADPKETAPFQQSDTSATGKELSVLSEQINTHPGDAALLHKRARLYIDRKSYAQALEDMNKVMAIDSSKAEYFLTMADLSFAANRTFNAKAFLERALQLDPANNEAANRLAELYFIVRDYNGAMELVNGVIGRDKKNTTAIFMKGMIYKESGDTSKAVSTFQNAVEIDPSFYNAYMQLGILYQIKNDPAAEGYFSNAIQINPRSEEAFYGRGLWYQEHNQLNKAIQDYTTIVQINPKNAKAHFNLGYIHHVLLDVKPEAIKHYTRAIEADPGYVEAYYNRGICYEAVGNLSDAAADFKEALKLRPVYPPAEEGLKRVMAKN